ncbi:ComEC/Rec2 family competence protein [Pseudomonas aeruginosa]
MGKGMAEGIEIDFLPVGNGEHSGDAIAIRWREGDVFRVLVYDGGTQEYGAALVEHIQKHFDTNHVDYLVNSHPDNDHAGGLTHIVETLSVGEVWMHRPWEYSSEIRHYFHDGRITDDSLAERLKSKMTAAFRLEEAALQRKIPIFEPFAGSRIGIFQVLSPTRERYVHDLIPAFEKPPELKVESAMEAVLDFGRKAIQLIAGAWDIEYLPDSVTTSAENESSAILFGINGGRGYLLTGDAGVESLKAAAEFATGQGINLPSAVNFVQIPHHGGRHNVSTDALNLIVGEPVPESHSPQRRAYVSASKKAPTHPKRVVTNAFIRRGFKIGQTKGVAIRHHRNMPARNGYGVMTYVPFHYEVEE